MSQAPTVRIYTDGACSGNQFDKNVGGWGAVLCYGAHTKELYGGEADTTNNRMELMGLISALEALNKKGLSIEVYSDSSYLINCMKKKWYIKWRANGWKSSTKAPVANKELWERLLLLCEGQALSYYLVKGHVDIAQGAASLAALFAKFKEHNGPGFSYEDFLHITEKNNRADALAGIAIEERRA